MLFLAAKMIGDGLATIMTGSDVLAIFFGMILALIALFSGWLS